MFADNISPKTKKAARTTPSYRLSCPVFLIGFMGAGKTSVARRLARICRLTSVDMDTYIERREGKRVSALFADSGEAGFRSIESAVLRELSKREPMLVSCGGGIVLKPENRELLKSSGFVLYLRVSAFEAAGRISEKSTRPLFKDVDNAQKVLEDRLPYYAETADAVLDTEGKDIARIALEAKGILQKEGILWQEPK